MSYPFHKEGDPNDTTQKRRDAVKPSRGLRAGLRMKMRDRQRVRGFGILCWEASVIEDEEGVDLGPRYYVKSC